jgi:hypothetical protein
MASNIKASPQEKEVPEKEAPEAGPIRRGGQEAHPLRQEARQLGRPKIDSATERKVRKQLAKGLGILKVAKSLGIGTGTVQCISKELG